MDSLGSKLGKLMEGFRYRGTEGVAKSLRLYLQLKWRRKRNTILRRYDALRGERSTELEFRGCSFELASLPDAETQAARLRHGRYEEDELALIDEIDWETDVIEMGGCLGVLSCILNRRLPPDRHHVILEPSPDAVPLLRSHLKKNRCEAEVVHAAYHPTREAVVFQPADSTTGGGIAEGDNGEVVPAYSLASLVDEVESSELSLVVDIEGLESELLDAECNTYVDCVSTLLIEFHSIPEQLEATERLRSAGFRLVGESGPVCLFRQ
jgi:FkbM family methyltransferase